MSYTIEPVLDKDLSQYEYRVRFGTPGMGCEKDFVRFFLARTWLERRFGPGQDLNKLPVANTNPTWAYSFGFADFTIWLDNQQTLIFFMLATPHTDLVAQ